MSEGIIIYNVYSSPSKMQFLDTASVSLRFIPVFRGRADTNEVVMIFLLAILKKSKKRL
jgi:hypothetical protein